MLQLLDLARYPNAHALWALQRKAYQQEALLIDFRDLPPLRESIEDLMALQEIALGWVEQNTLQGAISYQSSNAGLEICRPAVDAAFQRAGIGRRPLSAVVDRAQGHTVCVSTAAANLPALRLYQSMQFGVVGYRSTPEGLHRVHLQRLGLVKPSL
jgi:ribosomal protein S18 acetylase RimI-like enzyme